MQPVNLSNLYLTFAEKYFMSKYHLLFALLLTAFTAQAQFHQPLFTDLEGEELADAVKDFFRPNSTPGSDFARDVLYADIYNVNGFVSCVYTGFTINLGNGDPSQNAFAAGINAEHTMPRSFLEGTGNEFDLHNLYPTRINVNSDRSNFPFADIPDAQTDNWYYLDFNQSSVPTANIDLYSEQINGFFEPREDHKGNAARAMFYTYAVYGEEIDGNAPQYFESQRQTLCEWHIQDPADQIEYDRTYLIGSYQEDLPNPFVLDCTLATRMFCQDLEIECTPPMTSNTAETLQKETVSLTAANPIAEGDFINLKLTESAEIKLSVYDMQGNLVRILANDTFAAGTQSFDFQGFGARVFILVAETGRGEREYLKVVKF